MTRLPRNRDTHLTAEEIAVEVLALFDAGSTAPSIRQLARALDVTPSAIYHHYPSRAAIYSAGVNLVWQEATRDVVELLPDTFETEPVELLVTAGVATRRAFLRHYRIAPYVATRPEPDSVLANVFALISAALERLGLEGDEAAACFHTYASLTLGAVIFAATRKIADDELGIVHGDEPYRSEPGADEASHSSADTRAAIDELMDLSAIDPQRDEDLFAAGLRRLVESFTAQRPSGLA